MIRFGTHELWQRTRRELMAPTGAFHKGEWMDSGDDPDLSPAVFLIEMGPQLVANPHFHRNNQFQVFLKGSGSIGVHELGPVTVHYAGAYTGYGPLKASDEGLWYFTMRPVLEAGAQYLPESRDQVVKGPKRQATGEVSRRANTDELKSLGDLATETVIAAADDKLAASVTRVPPDRSFVAGDPAGSGGQFFVVLSGEMLVGERRLHEWEQVFVSADEKPFEVQAGAEGLEVLFLQFPLKAPEYEEAWAQLHAQAQS